MPTQHVQWLQQQVYQFPDAFLCLGPQPGTGEIKACLGGRIADNWTVREVTQLDPQCLKKGKLSLSAGVFTGLLDVSERLKAGLCVPLLPSHTVRLPSHPISRGLAVTPLRLPCFP